MTGELSGEYFTASQQLGLGSTRCTSRTASRTPPDSDRSSSACRGGQLVGRVEDFAPRAAALHHGQHREALERPGFHKHVSLFWGQSLSSLIFIHCWGFKNGL